MEGDSMKQSKRDFVRSVQQKQCSTLPDMPDWATPLQGLEGPFMYRSGRVLYYDPQKGQYYDRRTDMYLSNEEIDIVSR